MSKRSIPNTAQLNSAMMNREKGNYRPFKNFLLIEPRLYFTL